MFSEIAVTVDLQDSAEVLDVRVEALARRLATLDDSCVERRDVTQVAAVRRFQRQAVDEAQSVSTSRSSSSLALVVEGHTAHHGLDVIADFPGLRGRTRHVACLAVLLLGSFDREVLIQVRWYLVQMILQVFGWWSCMHGICSFACASVIWSMFVFF